MRAQPGGGLGESHSRPTPLSIPEPFPSSQAVKYPSVPGDVIRGPEAEEGRLMVKKVEEGKFLKVRKVLSSNGSGEEQPAAGTKPAHHLTF